MFVLPNSRENEQEADRIGVELAARAGYDLRAAIWKVSVCVHDYGGTPKNMACRTRHGAGGRGSTPMWHPAPRGGLQQPMVAALACPPAPGRTGVAAGQPPGAGLGRRPEAR